MWGKKLITTAGYHWMHQAEIISICFSLWIMHRCNESFAFKQPPSHAARRYTTAKWSTLLHLCSPHALSHSTGLGTEENTELWGRTASPQSFWQLFCTAFFRPMHKNPTDSTSLWKGNFHSLEVYFYCPTGFLVLFLALWVPVPSIQDSWKTRE